VKRAIFWLSAAVVEGVVLSFGIKGIFFALVLAFAFTILGTALKGS